MMSNEHSPFDSDSRSLLQELAATPVSRRWMLKAGLGSAAAMALQLPSGPAAAAEARVSRSSRLPLHFALGTATGVTDLVLVANGGRFPLVPHTAASRAALRARGGLWRVMDLSALTHYVSAVPWPAERSMAVSVYGRRGQAEVVVSQLWCVPPKATRALALAAYRLTRSLGSVQSSPARLEALGLLPSHITSPEHVVQLESIGDPHQTACTLTMLHPNVATVDPTASATTMALLGQTPEVSTLGSYIGQMQQAGQDYATLVPAVDATGNPSQIKVGSQTTTFSTVQLNQTDTMFTAKARSAFVAGIQGVRDTGRLGKVLNQPLDAIHDPQDTSTWHQPEGVIIPPTPYQPSTGLQSGVTAQVKNPGLLYGTYTALNGALSGRQVPLKLYNNYVRWVWVYVQYLKADGTNLSLDPGATFPDTKYSRSLGLLPQIFTLLGVPIWDSNTIEVTLDFPPEAASARL